MGSIVEREQVSKLKLSDWARLSINENISIQVYSRTDLKKLQDNFGQVGISF
jgi:hypothetical protein